MLADVQAVAGVRATACLCGVRGINRAWMTARVTRCAAGWSDNSACPVRRWCCEPATPPRWRTSGAARSSRSSSARGAHKKNPHTLGASGVRRRLRVVGAPARHPQQHERTQNRMHVLLRADAKGLTGPHPAAKPAWLNRL